MNKPVNCRCGGEAKVDIKLVSSSPVERKRIYCSKCYISTDWMKSEDEAIHVWNRVMGERTAIVKDFGHPCGTYGYCSNCGGYCVNEEPYCPHCGAKVKWE